MEYNGLEDAISGLFSIFKSGPLRDCCAGVEQSPAPCITSAWASRHVPLKVCITYEETYVADHCVQCTRVRLGVRHMWRMKSSRCNTKLTEIRFSLAKRWDVRCQTGTIACRPLSSQLHHPHRSQQRIRWLRWMRFSCRYVLQMERRLAVNIGLCTSGLIRTCFSIRNKLECDFIVCEMCALFDPTREQSALGVLLLQYVDYINRYVGPSIFWRATRCRRWLAKRLDSILFISRTCPLLLRSTNEIGQFLANQLWV